MYRTLYPTTEYTFFSSAHGTISRLDYMLGHKLSLNRLKDRYLIVSSPTTTGWIKKSIIKGKLENSPNCGN